MLIKEIMSKHVITVQSDSSVFDACQLYQQYKVGCLLVLDREKTMVGIVTERDFIERTICAKKNPETTKVSDIMTRKLITIHSLDKIEKAIELMKKHDVKKLPVVYNNAIAGIITVTDLSRARPELSKRFMDSWVKPDWVD